MIRFLSIILAGILTSFFVFPIELTFFPYANTKMMLAFLGLLLFLFRMTGKGQVCSKDFITVSLFAVGVSFASLVAIILNSTEDITYVSYIISMWVWLGAAYFVTQIIKQLHGTISLELICFYIVGVGVFQCVMAILIDMYVPIKEFVRLFLAGNSNMGNVEGRLYGIGCSTDVGGGRLAAILIMNMWLLLHSIKNKKNNIRINCLLISFLIISILGNMVARTTSVGMLLSIVWFCIAIGIIGEISKENKQYIIKLFSIVLLLSVCIMTYLYQTDTFWKNYLRFGFEGFFSLVEKGEWDVHSNNMLKEGYIFPDNLKTWLIGDGYIADPDLDPYYIGPASWGFYMNTDVGYSRFIFYFGLLGLCTFSMFFIHITQICIKRFKQDYLLFLFLLILHFAIWMKVTTDIFVMFAMFLCVSSTENEIYERNKSISNID